MSSSKSKGKREISFDFDLDLQTEVVGDVEKQTFVDKRLLLNFFVRKSSDGAQAPPSPRKLGSASFNLIDLLSIGTSCYDADLT